MSDALLFEPVPYRSALRENCTHVIALRTRADNISVTVKMGLMEKMIMSRFFGRKQGLPELVNWMHNQVCVCSVLYLLSTLGCIDIIAARFLYSTFIDHVLTRCQ
jgi:hypothetical protein